MKKNVIWITGASSGIGAELAKQYAKEGTFLILSARREKALQEVKNSCEHQENITVLPLDLKDFKSMAQHVEKALTVYGSIDLLINNGGVSQRSLIADTKIEVYQELRSFGMEVDVYDPLANPVQALREYGIALIQDIELSDYQAVLLAVPHETLSTLDIKTSPQCVVYDLKGVLPRKKVDKRL